jgi:hypothetical protein
MQVPASTAIVPLLFWQIFTTKLASLGREELSRAIRLLTCAAVPRERGPPEGPTEAPLRIA